jgi:Rieske Fe-S protein
LSPSHDDHPHVPGPSLWPVGFAIGIVVLLIGLIISWYVAGLGLVVALAFAFLWVRDLATGSHLAHAPDVPAESAAAAAAAAAGEPDEPAAPQGVPAETYPRSKFLELSTLGLGGVLGGLITAPAIGFMVIPPFLKQGVKDHDIGPISDFPEGKFVVATFMLDAEQGAVSRRSAYVRNNGQLNGLPSFTIMSNRCAHLGCPVQPNGPLDTSGTKQFADVTLVPAISLAGFGCPCHGGQYDTEGNRVAGPPVRALDRYSFSIKNGRLFLGKVFSVGHVDGVGANAKIHKWSYSFPGEPVSGLESWFYPIQPPH